MRETHDKIVASFVDVSSICLAYSLGVSHFGMWEGLGYGLFDAWIVIWQRDRISNFIYRAGVAVKQITPMKKKAEAIPVTVN
jgi:hypothetical protein